MDANFIPGSGQKENKLKIAIIDPSEDYKTDLKNTIKIAMILSKSPLHLIH